MNSKRFSTFEGVFTPTLLSILGVIMYLRLGWVVGQAGLGGALLIIVISNLITICTGLSIASITTNMRVGVGGAYSIISKSLGLEVGGAIGIPLYLSQALSVAFYITGFSECWVAVFPAHSFILVSLAAWLLLLAISYTSARLAFRLQYLIMAIIALSLVSVFLSKGHLAAAEGLSLVDIRVPFWKVFVIFFPAVTGILAGVSMSGELRNPQRSIPLGTLSAIAVAFFIYLSMAFWFKRMAAPGELIANTSIIIELSRWRLPVIAGIMGATLSSALSMFVASSRTLLALGKHRIIPMSLSFAGVNRKGEPAAAIIFTAFLSLLAISLGNLNRIAGVLTMFFLITYGMLNISVFIEKGLGIVSFRPRFRVHPVFSFLGSIGCFYAMFLINPFFSLVSVLLIIIIYAVLLRRQMKREWPDVRKGVFIFIAEQALKISGRLPYHPKIWKPNLLVPVLNGKGISREVEFIKAIVAPSGRTDFFKIVPPGKSAQELQELKENLRSGLRPLREEGVLCSSVVLEAGDFSQGAKLVMQLKCEDCLPPNVLFVDLDQNKSFDPLLKELIYTATDYGLGNMVLRLHPDFGLGHKKKINFWVRRGSPNVNLAVLVALQLESNWDAELRIFQAVSADGEEEASRVYLRKLKKIARLPADTAIYTIVDEFNNALSSVVPADINIFGMPQEIDLGRIREISEKIKTSVLFLKDSRQESAFV